MEKREKGEESLRTKKKGARILGRRKGSFLPLSLFLSRPSVMIRVEGGGGEVSHTFVSLFRLFFE